MPDFSRAIEGSILKGFTIKPIESENTSISGRIQGCNDQFIYIKIDEGFEELLCYVADEEQLFNVRFFINRMNYQLQHNALTYMQNHILFPILINNPRYSENDDELRVHMSDILEHKFR